MRIEVIHNHPNHLCLRVPYIDQPLHLVGKVQPRPAFCDGNVSPARLRFRKHQQDQLRNPHLQTPAGFGERLLQRGNLLFLLDGLDEVAALAQREQVARWIVDGWRAHPTCRFVVTSRFAGYSPTVRLSADSLEMHIRPFTAEQAERFIHNWYAVVEERLS